MPAWEVVLKVGLGLVLIAVAGVRLVRQLRTRKYGADGFDWEQHHLNILAMIVGFIGLGLIVSATG